MLKYITISAAFIIGALTSVQSAINTELGKYVGGLTSALISFLVGTLSLSVIYIFAGEKGIFEITKVPPYLLIGGMLGATFVYGMIKVIPLIGVSGSLAGVIAGQLILAMVIDHFGWFGVAAHKINIYRVLAAFLLLSGATLMKK